ncbi:hypothetical protein BAUCODRAFT_34267 [Baudoinia panamericana UAMH 10762]|uniref:Major facilitator superfamily (MFS) profile domain-containing protein n=1 Tax=Baudoinia panamericana (strain UAMH 10762) TaxID=717646 RepID=M2MJK1_BAUPA|nr:uncharacterized protein BAUCODRAFT_34267 [Baudoinia panamericana UAMH 10762]EMC96871.1 hypothetical protein BAUCODRAFT_34267 [Baudoinia panamericana UAMH 10762]
MASGFDGVGFTCLPKFEMLTFNTQSMTNAMQLLPVWLDRFNHPTGSTLGFFGASTGIGGVVGLVLLSWVGDKFGRRAPTVIGALLIVIGALIQTWASDLGMFIGGKILLGCGVSTVQLGAPVLVAELSHPKERATVGTFYNTSIYLGYVVGAWITFGVAKMNNQWQWKIPTLLQILPSAYQLALIWFCPESPRWLVAHGHEERAKAILIKYHGNGDPASPLVDIEFAEIKEAIARDAEANTTWREVFRSRTNWKRIGLCICVAVFSQTTGNLLVSNYLSSILIDTGLNSSFDSTLINGMVTLWSYIVTLAVAALIDRFPRRTFFLFGSGGTMVVFIVWTICAQQYSERNSVTAGRVVIACIFLFQTFYSIAWLNMVALYPLEICPYTLRAKMWALVLLVIYAAQIFGNYVNPVGIAAVGWKFYIYYCVWVTIIFFIVYFCFVETQGPTLEELALIFDDAAAGDRKASVNGSDVGHEKTSVKVVEESAKIEQYDP